MSLYITNFAQNYFNLSKIMPMSEIKNDRRKWYQRLQDSYKVQIIDEDDLREVGAFNLSILNFYILLSTFAVLLGMLTVSLIVFTPIKRWIPGYNNITDNSLYIELVQKIDYLESELEAQQVYTASLSKLLQGVQADKVDVIDAGTIEKLRDQEVRESKLTKELNQFVFASPVKGVVSAEYDPSIGHYGVDIVAPKNTVIKSVLDGVVISSDWSLESGNTIYIQHPRNIISAYKHNSALLVKAGDIVKTGQAIAIIGNTGEMTTGPHLHLELWFDGIPVNPQNYLILN